MYNSVSPPSAEQQVPASLPPSPNAQRSRSQGKPAGGSSPCSVDRLLRPYLGLRPPKAGGERAAPRAISGA